MLSHYPNICPMPGLVFDAYMSRKEIGSGVRTFVLYRMGRKYVHVFYHAKLMALSLTHREFKALYIAPVSGFDVGAYRRNLTKRREAFDRLGIRYSALIVDRVLHMPLRHGSHLFGTPELTS